MAEIYKRLVGERVKEARKRRGLSQDELAGTLGYTNRAAICQIESGKRAIPVRKLQRMAQALDVSTEYLLGTERDYTITDARIKELWHAYRTSDTLTKIAINRLLGFPEYHNISE